MQRKTTFLITQKTKYFFSYFTLISLFWLRFYIFFYLKKHLNSLINKKLYVKLHIMYREIKNKNFAKGQNPWQSL